jgi:hypothetical protein
VGTLKKKKKKCEICGAELLNPNSKSHINSKKHQKALKAKGHVESVSTVGLTSVPSDLESRVASLESSMSSLNSRVSFLIDEFTSLQKRIGTISVSSQSREISHDLILNKIDEFNKDRRSTGNWITIDDLVSALSKKTTNWSAIQTTIIKMFDRGLVDLIDGRSSKKINMRGRNFGLIRRRF